MTITSFNPLIVTKDAEATIALFEALGFERRHMKTGINDKDITSVLALLPKDATYYFTQASVSRALPATEVQHLAERIGLSGQTYATVKEAYQAALASAHPDDFVFVGGSTFIVADLLSFLTDSF